MTEETNSSLPRHCLMTVGATVGFKSLVEEAIHFEFLEGLKSHGFTDLHMQCGPDVQWATDRLASIEDEVPPGLSVKLFDYSKDLMQEEMTLCKPSKERRRRGLVISHAGTGTVLDAWKLNVPIIVVPNTELLDNHQVELAKHLSVKGYATMGTACRRNLLDALDKNHLLWEENKARWPPNHLEKEERERISLWEIHPAEVQEEEQTRMRQG